MNNYEKAYREYEHHLTCPYDKGGALYGEPDENEILKSEIDCLEVENKRLKQKEQECKELKAQVDFLLNQLITLDGDLETVKVTREQFKEYVMKNEVRGILDKIMEVKNE